MPVKLRCQAQAGTGGLKVELPLPLGEGVMRVDGGQAPMPLRDDIFGVDGGEAALPLKEGFMGVDGGQSPLPPLPLGEGVMGDLCIICANVMDLAAVVGCLLDQVDMWPGIPFA